MTATLIEADCRTVLATLQTDSVACTIADPPYEIDMNRQSWDRDSAAFDPATWAQVKRVVTPGGFVAAFGGTRTFHRLAVAMEDGGLTLTDTVCWLYTTGNVTNKDTQLKRAWEPIVLAQARSGAPLRTTMAQHGTGFLGIEECRLPYLDDADLQRTLAKNPGRGGETFTSTVYGVDRPQQSVNVGGRHPANLIVDERIADALREDRKYFLCPKASRKERDAGLSLAAGIARNPHICVKPMALMEWLVRLLCPTGGLVLDPFAGSASTGCGALLAGRRFLGIEADGVYVQTGRLRLDYWGQEAARRMAAASAAAGEDAPRAPAADDGPARAQASLFAP